MESHSLFVGDLALEVTDLLLQKHFQQFFPSVNSAKVPTKSFSCGALNSMGTLNQLRATPLCKCRSSQNEVQGEAKDMALSDSLPQLSGTKL